MVLLSVLAWSGDAAADLCVDDCLWIWNVVRNMSTKVVKMVVFCWWCCYPGKDIFEDNLTGKYICGDNLTGKYICGDNLTGKYICGDNLLAKIYVEII